MRVSFNKAEWPRAGFRISDASIVSRFDSGQVLGFQSCRGLVPQWQTSGEPRCLFASLGF